MERTVLRNRKGYSLIEVLVSIAILAVVAVSIMQISIMAMRQNIKNAVRDEAVRVSEQYVTTLAGRSLNFTDPNGFNVDLNITGGAFVTLPTVTRTFRGGVQVGYNARKNVANMTTGTKNSRVITVEIKWKYGGENFTHMATSITGGD